MTTASIRWARRTMFVLMAGCFSCGSPVRVVVQDGTTYEAPQEAGVLNTADGTEFELNSTVGGLTAVVRFRVPANRTYETRYGGRDVFDIHVRLSQATAAVVTLEYETWKSVDLDEDTDYYLEIEQTGGAMMGATVVTIRDG